MDIGIGSINQMAVRAETILSSELPIYGPTDHLYIVLGIDVDRTTAPNIPEHPSCQPMSYSSWDIAYLLPVDHTADRHGDIRG